MLAIDIHAPYFIIPETWVITGIMPVMPDAVISQIKHPVICTNKDMPGVIFCETFDILIFLQASPFPNVHWQECICKESLHRR